MTTVPPPNTALPQMLAAAAAPTIVVVQPPPALSALAPGTVLEAVVLPPPATTPAPAPQTPIQNVTLHTALGDVAVRLPVPVPPNTQIEIELVRVSTSQVTARVVNVGGQSAAQYVAQSRLPEAASTPAPLPANPVPAPRPFGPPPLAMGFAWMPAGPAPVLQLGPVSALVTLAPSDPTGIPPAAVLPPQTPAGSGPSTAPTRAMPTASPPAPTPTAGEAAPTTLATLPLTTGSELTVRLVSVQMPGAPAISIPVSQTAPAPVAAPAMPQGAAPVPSPGAAPAPAILPDLPLAGRGGLPAPLPQPPAAVSPAARLAAVSGVVIATHESIPVIDVEGRQIQINMRANLPVGTRLVLEIAALGDPRPAAAPPAPAAALPFSGPAGSAAGWPTLTESLSVLQRSDPAGAQQLAQAIPDGGPRSVTAAIAFVQAMRSGDARQWPGDTALRALERAGPRGAHLAAQLSGEVAELANRTREGGAEWRATPIPWNAEGQIERVNLITRREGDGEEQEKTAARGGGTRFLLDLTLSRLGPMQLDGMFRKQTRSFDLMLRTHTPLPEEMRRDLIGLFAHTNAAMGLAGGLTFQVTKKFADPLGANGPVDKSGLWA